MFKHCYGIIMIIRWFGLRSTFYKAVCQLRLFRVVGRMRRLGPQCRTLLAWSWRNLTFPMLGPMSWRRASRGYRFQHRNRGSWWRDHRQHRWWLGCRHLINSWRNQCRRWRHLRLDRGKRFQIGFGQHPLIVWLSWGRTWIFAWLNRQRTCLSMLGRNLNQQSMGSMSQWQHRGQRGIPRPCPYNHHCNRSRWCRKRLSLLVRGWHLYRWWRICRRRPRWHRKPSMNRIVIGLWWRGSLNPIVVWRRSFLGRSWSWSLGILC